MIDITRHKRIFDTEHYKPSIVVAGAGTIGSNTALLLARLGLENITVYDADKVEAHNLGAQAYRTKDIGKPKVEALADIIKDATGTAITPVNEMTDGKGLTADVLVLGVDTMKARQEISNNATFAFCVDGRIGGETFNVFSFTSFELEKYNDTLFSDDEGVDLPCGEKSIGYIGYAVSAIIVNAIKRLTLGQTCPFQQSFCFRNLTFLTFEK